MRLISINTHHLDKTGLELVKFINHGSAGQLISYFGEHVEDVNKLILPNTTLLRLAIQTMQPDKVEALLLLAGINLQAHSWDVLTEALHIYLTEPRYRLECQKIILLLVRFSVLTDFPISKHTHASISRFKPGFGNDTLVSILHCFLIRSNKEDKSYYTRLISHKYFDSGLQEYATALLAKSAQEGSRTGGILYIEKVLLPNKRWDEILALSEKIMAKLDNPPALTAKLKYRDKLPAYRALCEANARPALKKVNNDVVRAEGAAYLAPVPIAISAASSCSSSSASSSMSSMATIFSSLKMSPLDIVPPPVVSAEEKAPIAVLLGPPGGPAIDSSLPSLSREIPISAAKKTFFSSKGVNDRVTHAKEIEHEIKINLCL